MSQENRNQTLAFIYYHIICINNGTTSHKFEDKCVSIVPMYLGEKSIFHRYSAILSKKKKK